MTKSMNRRIDTPKDAINSITSRQVSRSLCVVGLALLLSTTGGFLVGCRSEVKEEKSRKAYRQKSTDTEVTSTPFQEKNNGEEYNASGVVPLGDSHFLFCDNNLNDALMELVVSKDGQQQGPLVRRPLVGLKESIDDMEELTIVEQGGRRLVFALTSLSVKLGSKKKGREDEVRPGGLLRITIKPDGFLATELMSDFRAWLIVNAPEIGASAENDPELGGLNIEGLGWDARRGALLLGIRTPVPGGKPLIRPVRIKDLAGPWTTDNLEMLPAIHLAVENEIGEQGIRSITTNGFGEGFFVVVGNSTSESKAPFSVYTWDGGDDGKVTRLPISFHKKMKPEGITTGTIGGRKAVLFVDDGGGFSVLWSDGTAFEPAATP